MFLSVKGKREKYHEVIHIFHSYVFEVMDFSECYENIILKISHFFEVRMYTEPTHAQTQLEQHELEDR